MKRYKTNWNNVWVTISTPTVLTNLGHFGINVMKSYEPYSWTCYILDIDSAKLFIAKHPVGVDSRVQDLIQLLNNQKADGVLIIAIWGMAGIGKTTIAKALYNQISHNFEVRTFVPHIQDREEDYLRRELLLFLRDQVKRKAHNFDSTRKLWWEGVRCLKVLLILDNVRSERELEVLPVTRECFGPGSIIIITTRTKHDRHQEIGVNHIYRVKEMDYNECVELFSWSAFNKATPERSFSGLINYAIEYSDGLPLALVCVSSAVSEKSVEEWENVLDSFKRLPFQDVWHWQVLKENIDSVGYAEKEIFLELAYLRHLFIGINRNDINQILQEAGCNAAPRAIKRLEEHSLVWFDEDKLCKNRLLQDIRREWKRRNESEDIKNIVEQVTHMLEMKELFVANHPVGIESRVEEVIQLLKDQQQENPLLRGI
ncbi:disease resistance protein Roq1-like [Arachis stenosperma]|uniref:disease resistance protein Roq1-like n=1 Tax=Arachis stenosperma TaxID=217475 RepID=UPI0025ABAD9A|nr:disease resistance protein Roq1-like [Arachis stenosperma]